MVVVPAAVEGAALATALVPFVLHRWDMYRWDKAHRDEHRPKGTNHREPLFVLLPVWNEAVVIKKKLDNLALQKIPIRLVVVDSASTDNTVRLVEDWLAKRGSVFESHEVLKMPVRKGKTAAVVKALEHIGQHRDGLICMTDADALLEEGVLHRMMQWFADPMIGAVGALPNRQQARLEEREHRESWDGMRLAESMVDSTPFLEGSCMMWRPSCLAIDDLNVGSNADDAQIATSVRTRGWRTVVDTRARFVDAAPASIEEQRRQKVRRAQGLQRLLIQRRKRATARTQGMFAKIMRRQFHFHITAPLALTVACISAIMRWVFIALYGWPATFTLANSLHLGFTVAEILCVGLWWRSRSGKNNGPLSLLGRWLSSMELLGRSLFTTARGTSLHMWEQHTDVRDAVVELEV